jgi:hypothetical protein
VCVCECECACVYASVSVPVCILVCTCMCVFVCVCKVHSIIVVRRYGKVGIELLVLLEISEKLKRLGLQQLLV